MYPVFPVSACHLLMSRPMLCHPLPVELQYETPQLAVSPSYCWMHAWPQMPPLSEPSSYVSIQTPETSLSVFVESYGTGQVAEKLAPLPMRNAASPYP